MDQRDCSLGEMYPDMKLINSWGKQGLGRIAGLIHFWANLRLEYPCPIQKEETV